MPKFAYTFTGTVAEDFPYLPSDPPSRTLQPGDIVECSEAVDHPRLELVGKPSKKTDTAAPEPAAEPTVTTPEEA